MTKIVYVLSHPAMPDLIKIGKTDKTLASRMKSLVTAGVPGPFKCEFAAELHKRYENSDIERRMHRAFKGQRYRGCKEWFKISAEQAISILEILGDDITPSSESPAKGTRYSARGPVAKWISELNIPEGSILCLKGDPKITAVVVRDQKFKFRGEIISPALATRRAKGWDEKKPARATDHWIFKGELVTDIYNRVHNKQK